MRCSVLSPWMADFPGSRQRQDRALTLPLPMKLLTLLFALLYSGVALSSSAEIPQLDLTNHWVGYSAIGLFVLAYVLVIMEEQLHLRKSKPVLLAAGLIWVLIAFA